MQNFLSLFVDYYLNQSSKKVDNQLIILPSKRSVSALKNTFANQKEPLWLPKITDIVTFIEDVSQLNIIDHEETILEFYKTYLIISEGKEVDAFENFHSWASVLIGDFNEIDRFLVNPDAFFEHHKALKKINYFGVEKTEMIQSYIQFWEDMPKYYTHFKAFLLNSNTAYQGLAYRQAAENIDNYLNQTQQTITFLGFNALNAAETKIIERCLKKGNTNIGWDIDKSYLEEKQHPSNFFIKNYIKGWEDYKKHFIDLNINSYQTKKNIQILSSPKSVGQAKSVAELLNQMTAAEIENTAIVLNDENLLHPLLNSIPKHVNDVNITMGLPLVQSPLTDFFTNLIDHQKSGNEILDHNFLKALFEHNVLNQNEFSDKSKIFKYLNSNNLKSISFSQLLTLDNFSQEMLSFLKCLDVQLNPVDFITCVKQNIDSLLSLHTNSIKQYLLAFKNIFTSLEKTFTTYPNLGFMALSILFREKIESEKLSFKGSKLKGLQIMGMLETRLLDFKNIILTSVNEGILPSGKTDSSYITFNLKKEYGLPTHTEKDAVYAYHFFRLLQRAKKCYLIYDNDQSGFNKGEKSRFITYLQVFKSPNHEISEKQFSLSTQLKAKELIVVEKSPDIILELNKLAKSGFSPTALTTYILNPVLFYKRYVLKVKEADTIEDVISHKDFGTLVHNTVETLYENVGYLDEQKLKVFKTKTDALLKKTFGEVYAKDDYKSGANRIQIEIAKAYLMKFFEKESYDLKRNKTEILSIEESVNSKFKTLKHTVFLKGKIDRVDKHGEDLRIIDLKTGKVEGKNLRFDDFEDLISDYDYSKVFQILFYALLYSKKYKFKTIKAGIISFKNLNEWFIPLKYDNKQLIDQEMLGTFEVYLSKLIDEILDPNVPFTEKEINFG